MARFRLVPLEEKSANEQLWDCARMGCTVVLKRYGWFKLYGQYRQDLLDRCQLACVEHFLNYKVLRHRYNRKFDFSANVISSAWSTCHHQADLFFRELNTANTTDNIDDVAFSLRTQDGLPLYINDNETPSRRERYERPIERMTNARSRAIRCREKYEEYLADVHDLGLSEVLDFGAWAARTGYSKDEELMLALEPRDVRKKMLRDRARNLKESELATRLTRGQRNQREYMREYKRRRYWQAIRDKSRELSKLYGEPPEGHVWRELRGKVCLYKLKEEK